MKEVTVLASQTLIDIATQELGDATRLFELALLNGLLPSDEITAGQVLVVPNYAPGKSAVVKALQINNPATRSTVVEQENLEGIGYWGIGIDFIIS